jgi:hypothetical protein
MKPTTDWIRSTLAFPAAFVLALAPLSAAQAGAQGPFNPKLLQDNLKNLFSPNDEAKTGAGDKDSAYRKKIGPAVLRGDLKVNAGFRGDARGQNNDDLMIDESADGTKQNEDDAKKGFMPSLEVVAGGALDLDFGICFEALSVEYKKDLLGGGPKEFFKPAEPKSTAPEQSALVKLLSNDDLTVKIAGFTVRCGGKEDQAGALGKDTEELSKKALNNGALLKNGLKIQFWAGCVPIIVRGNAGLSLSLNLGPAVDLEHAAFGVELEPGVYAHGWLSAGIGGAVGPFSVSAGIAGKLRLLDTTLQLEGGVELAGDPSLYGSIKLVIQPVKFDAQLFAQVQGWCLSRTFTWTVFTAQMDKIEKQIGGTPRDLEPAAVEPPSQTLPATEEPAVETNPRRRAETVKS